MAGLVIVAHAPLATALRAVAGHCFAAEHGAIEAVDVPASWSADEAEAAVRDAVRRAGGDEVLVLADVFGATPCNAAQRVADGQRVRLAAGVNVPMLWRAMCYAALPLDQRLERALSGGAQGVMPASPQRPQDQTLHSQPHDPSHRHHQQ
ncbi:MAG: PTS fructose transporter subunit IIA [Burkholderiales bacterium]|nr:PTS fructose transporter subunit IIA [Burkholderiales bacterium]